MRYIEKEVRYRFGRQDSMRKPPENVLEFFGFLAISSAVACSVNPQVPGSSPGRGAKYTKPRSDAGLLNFNYA
jgi:hypothetical protein